MHNKGLKPDVLFQQLLNINFMQGQIQNSWISYQHITHFIQQGVQAEDNLEFTDKKNLTTLN